MMTSQTQRIYLDYSATTPVDPEVTEAMSPYFTRYFGNASSIHAFGRETKILLEESREKIARAVGAKAGEIFFTSGGTKRITTPFSALRLQRNGRTGRITSLFLRWSIMQNFGAPNIWAAMVLMLQFSRLTNSEKSIPMKSVRRSCRGLLLFRLCMPITRLAQSKNIEEIARVAHDHGLVFHSDTVQSVGKIPVNVDALSIDILAISAHKFYGPKGIGAIYIRKGVDVDSYIHGGAQERNRRAGNREHPLRRRPR